MSEGSSGAGPLGVEALVRKLVELTERRTRALEAGDYEAAVAVGAERSRIIEALLARGAGQAPEAFLSPEAARLIQQVVEADRAALRQVQAEMLRVKEELKRVRQARSRLRPWGNFGRGGGFERQA